MDFVDVDRTLKELDDLDADLFKDSLKKVPEWKSEDEKIGTFERVTEEMLLKETNDEFDDDDDIADLLSDDVFGKLKAGKAVSDVAVEKKKVGKASALSASQSFGSLDDGKTTNEAPANTYGENREDRTKDMFDNDSYLGFSDFEKGLNASDNRRSSTFKEDVLSPEKMLTTKEDHNFLTNKVNSLKDEGSARTMQTQKKKDEVNFDDSEVLDDLGLDDPLAKPSKVKTNPRPSEKKGSFMDDLFGSTKKEQNVPLKKQQEFALNEKYKSAERKEDSDSFGFGSYVPSSAAPSGPTSRRKSVKFDDESMLPKTVPVASRHKSFTKQDSFLDDPVSPVNKPKVIPSARRGSAIEDLSSRSPKIKGSSFAAENPLNDNPLKKTGSDITSPSKGRDRDKDWLGLFKDDKVKGQQSSPKQKSLDFLEKTSPIGRGDTIGQRRRSSGADWLGIEKSDNTDYSTIVSETVNVPPQQINILNAGDPMSPGPRQVQNFPSVRESTSAPLDQFVSSIKMPHSVGMSKSEVPPVAGQQSSAAAVDLQAGVTSNVSAMGSVVTSQVPLQHMNANVLPIHQYAAVETQNNFMALQSMISSLQLEKEQLSKSVEAVKLRHEEEVKAVESSQKNQMKIAEESFKNQEKRVKEEFEAKIGNFESQLKDLTNEKADIIASYKEKINELKKDHNQEVQRLKDLHSRAISTMKEDHENALSRLKQLKDQEVEAISSTQVYARSLQHLTDQLEARATELAALQLKVDERHQKSLQERQNLLDAKDKELKEQKKKLDRQLEEGEEERARLQQLVMRLESRLQQVTKDGEEEKWNLQQTQAKLEIQKKMLSEEQNQAFQKIEREKEKVKLSQESLLQEQKTVLLQLAQERQQLSSEKQEMDLLSKRLREDETRLQSARLKGEATMEAERRSLLREKENVEMERARIRQESHQLQLDREEVERDRRQLQDEKEKLNDQKYGLHRRTQEIEDMSQTAKRVKEEAQIALSSANRMESDHKAQLEQISQQLSTLHTKETQILMEKSSLAEERKLLEMKKNSLLCASCKLSLSRPFAAFTSDATMQQPPPALTLSHVQAVTGMHNPANVDPSLLWWYITAQKDKDYLTNEQLFLQSLQESSRKKQELL